MAQERMVVGLAYQGWIVKIVEGRSTKREYHVWTRRDGTITRVQLFYGKGGCMDKLLDPNGPKVKEIKQVILGEHPLPWGSCP